jgi:tellurite methyltransferase
MISNWELYYENTATRVEPNKLLKQALESFTKESISPGLSLDLGAGAGRDTFYLLENGWKVTAIDYTPKALELIKSKSGKHPNLELKQLSFEDLELQNNPLLINACLSLPFCSEAAFNKLWNHLTEKLIPSGRFSGHFFGPEHGFKDHKTCIFHTYKEVLDLFKNYQIEYFEEENTIKTTSDKSEIRWHMFHVVAKKFT